MPGDAGSLCGKTLAQARPNSCKARFHGQIDFLPPGVRYEAAIAAALCAAALLVADAGSANQTSGPAGPARLALAADQGFWSFGYPAEKPFDGEKLAYCRSGLLTRRYPNWRVFRGTLYKRARAVSGPATMEIKCNMTGGSSGGGWIARFDGSHYGYVNGVNSYGDDETMDSPYFGDAAKNLWNYVQGR